MEAQLCLDGGREVDQWHRLTIEQEKPLIGVPSLLAGITGKETRGGISRKLGGINSEVRAKVIHAHPSLEPEKGA